MRLGLLALALATACEFPSQYCEGDWAAAPPEAAPPRSKVRTVAQVLPVESTAVDILFVIDDSGSMTDEQEQLGIWSRELFDVLSITGELPDLHLAVTSSSVAIPGLEQCRTGSGGSFHTGRAALEGGDRFLRDVAGPDGRARNYSGSLTETFAEMARVGDSGCGLEQPFKAARTALATPGFLRDDALLLVVFVTDEDDCSATDPALFSEPYADACSELGALTGYRCFEHGVRCYDGKGSRELGDRRNCQPDEDSRYMESVVGFGEGLKRLKRDPAQVVVAAIYGKPNSVTVVPHEKVTSFLTPRLGDVCGSGGVEGVGATPAIRLNALMAEFGGRASHSSICEPELAWAMRDAGLVTRGAATRSPCLRGSLVDTDPVLPGVQPRCRVEARTEVGTLLERRVELPSCAQDPSGRCFTIAADAACGDTESQLAFHVASTAANETLAISCEVEDAARSADDSIPLRR